MSSEPTNLDRLKMARIRDHELRRQDDVFAALPLRARALRRYRELSAVYPWHVVWGYFLGRAADRLRHKLGAAFKPVEDVSALEDALTVTKSTALMQDKLIQDVIERVQQGIDNGNLLRPIRYSIRITGGLGDALIIARMTRDLQLYLDNDLSFDVYFQSPALIEPFFRHIPGFMKCIDIDLYQRTVELYTFSLHANQFVLFVTEHFDHRALLTGKPEVLNLFGHIQRQRTELDRYVTNHPFLDGAFAAIATKRGHKRYTYLHEMLGIPYGGDELKLEIDATFPTTLGLVPGQYVTIHDGWDTKFKLAVHRPTKAIPLRIWTDVVKALKAERPELKLVQLGGKTGDNVPGIDINLKTRLSFMQSAAVLASAALHIDSESGLVHLGTALGIRSVVLFGPTNVDWFGYPQNANIVPRQCGDCWWSTDTWMDTCPIGHKEPVCTASIKAGEVAKAALQMLDRPYEGPVHLGSNTKTLA